MYEFVDVHGERVTVRSVRTLASLLQSGSITEATPFRRADDAAFGPAGRNPELQEIAAQVGVGLGAPRPGEPVPSPPAAPLSPLATEPAPVESRLPYPPPAPARPARASVSQVQRLVPRASPWSRFSPAKSRRRSVGTVARSTGLVLLSLCGAAVLGVVARAVVADASGSRAWAGLAMVATTALAGHYAGRTLARRYKRPNGWQVSLAAAMFTGGVYALIGGFGLFLALPACIMLWRSLSQPRR